MTIIGRITNGFHYYQEKPKFSRSSIINRIQVDCRFRDVLFKNVTNPKIWCSILKFASQEIVSETVSQFYVFVQGLTKVTFGGKTIFLFIYFKMNPTISEGQRYRVFSAATFGKENPCK